jgi:hypothetical protein
MFKRLLFLILVLSLANGSTSFAGTVQIPQTGQTKCYDSDGNEKNCAGTGQDGEIRTGAVWPIQRFIVGTGSEAECITDTLTGLMWARSPLSTKRTWGPAITYANDLVLCGHSDWRIPNMNEIESLVNTDEPDQAIWLSSQAFTNVMKTDNYWSSTTNSVSSNSAWTIYFGVYYFAGMAFSHDKTLTSRFAWPVRGHSSSTTQPWRTGQTISYSIGDDGDLKMGAAWPNPRFTVVYCSATGQCPDQGSDCDSNSSNDIIMDALTGLTWARNANPFGALNWTEALDYTNNLSLCGFSDWHLPNKKQLYSLTDYSRNLPAIPQSNYFINLQSTREYWSSTTLASVKRSAWSFFFWDGSLRTDYKDVGKYVLPVRSDSSSYYLPIIIK